MASSSRPQHRSGKRKRTAPPTCAAPDGAINPFSRSPGHRLQLSVAGVSDTDEDPTRRIKQFPHRSLDRGASEPSPDSVLDDGGHLDHEDGGAEFRATPHRRPARRPAATDAAGHLDVLLRSIHQFLDRGDVAKASRAYGLLLQLRIESRPIDIRKHNLWALGAEILLREGERPTHLQGFTARDDEGSHSHRQVAPTNSWGSPTNISKVKAYFETLIQQHPYDHKFPSSVSALDFQLSMLGCEIYSVHAQHTSALARADEGEAGVRNAEYLTQETIGHRPSPDPQGPQGDGDRQAERHALKNDLRLQALAAMRNINQRMDTLMAMLPYSKNNHFLQLRATASLYTADLLASQTMSTEHGAENSSQLERQVAIDALERLVANGGQLDRAAQTILDGSQAETQGEVLSPSPLYSSLPIRGSM